jgi:hypothetical protein
MVNVALFWVNTSSAFPSPTVTVVLLLFSVITLRTIFFPSIRMVLVAWVGGEVGSIVGEEVGGDVGRFVGGGVGGTVG